MKVVLFDGVCNLCNGLVNWVIDRDKKDQFLFSSLQSDYGKSVAAKYNLGHDYMDTVVLLDGDEVFFRSTAVLRLLRDLGGIYSLAYIFILVPPFIRNFFYKIVAQNRYRWFGKRDVCRIPTPQLKSKFLE